MMPGGSRRERIVVVLRAPSADRFAAAAAVLADAGVTRVEFTLTSAGALEAVTATKLRLPTLIVGCGTARSPSDITAAHAVGADFVVSQYFDPALAEAARGCGIPYVPGALTPGEIVAASGASGVVKISPIGPVGGVSYLRELVGPLPEIALFPTGGVRPEEVSEYFDVGAAFVGLSGLLLQDALVEGDLAALAARARRALAPLTASSLE